MEQVLVEYIETLQKRVILKLPDGLTVEDKLALAKMVYRKQAVELIAEDLKDVSVEILNEPISEQDTDGIDTICCLSNGEPEI